MLWRVFAQWFHGPPFPTTPSPAPPTSTSQPSLSGQGRQSGHSLWPAFCLQGVSVSHKPSSSLSRVGRGTLLETQSFSAQKPQNHLSVSFFWHYFARLQDKLDFMRPIRTQTERRFAAEPWGQLCAVLQDLWGSGIGQGSVLQWTLRKEDGGHGGMKGYKAEMPPL